MTPTPSTLASYSGDILTAVGVITALAGMVVLIGIVLHRKLNTKQSADPPNTAFDLDQLKQLHESGQLTQEEFDRAIDAMHKKGSDI